MLMCCGCKQQQSRASVLPTDWDPLSTHEHVRPHNVAARVGSAREEGVRCLACSKARAVLPYHTW